MKYIDLFFWSDNFNQEYTNFSLIQDYIQDKAAIKKHYNEDKKRWVSVYHDPNSPEESEDEKERIGVKSFIREFNIALARYKRHLIITFVSYLDLMLLSVLDSYFLFKPKLLIDHLNYENVSIKEIVKMIVDSSENSELLSDICNKASQKLNIGPIDQRITKLEKIFKFKFNRIAISNLSYLYRLRNYLVHERIECEISDQLLSIIYDTLDYFVIQVYQAFEANNYKFNASDKEYFDESIRETEPPNSVKILDVKPEL